MDFSYDNVGSQEMWNGMTPTCRCSRAPDPMAMTVSPAASRHPRARVIPFLEMRSFSFSSLNGTTSQTIILLPYLCVLQYTRLMLVARLHSSTMTSGQTLKFSVQGTMPTADDPSQDFVESTEFISVSFTSASSAPALSSRSATDPHEFVRLSLVATQTSVSSTFLATLSACLVLRES
jgi:hypothetical protein